MEKRKPMDVTIGTNMSKLRKQFNLTQREICSVVGVNTSTYKHYELGDRMVPISVLQDLAKFYKVSINYFFEKLLIASENLFIRIFNLEKETPEKLTEREIKLINTSSATSLRFCKLVTPTFYIILKGGQYEDRSY